MRAPVPSALMDSCAASGIMKLRTLEGDTLVYD